MPKESYPTAADKPRIALGVTGGIAAYKAAEILRGLQRAGCEVRVAMTRHACEFVQPLTFRALSGSYVVVDDYSPDNPDPIAHITFSQSIDLFIVAPATADIIAKFANGIADDFVSSTYLACAAPVLIAPAMNTVMWHHPATQRNLDRLRRDGVKVLEPDEGEMACGTIGPGRLSDPERIVSFALEILRGASRSAQQDLAGETFLITAGATREEIDPVRFISNRSSGRMGFAVAAAALARGAEVTIVSGATSVPPPPGARLIKTLSAEEMRSSVMTELPRASVFVGAAAVSDYRPRTRSSEKLKKGCQTMTIDLELAPDILSAVGHARSDAQLVIGFAAETDDLLKNARIKLKSKNLDAIVANDVSSPGAGFDSERNAVTIVTANTEQELPLMPKIEVAHRILDEIIKLRLIERTIAKADTVSAR
ncbi:MAG: phosphopantothenoylcysteine decarboxylase / phosphopantothenate---cysteine ligase [Blastocatellia bacterium]|jgi:phosphopantothenoylcysteine decarboxylase/phosphopantothenate--cysteine ligase|nr:phosphopantothenoylcysteine decarboxylase / phosphopantothenate---cysteine ligase [Blastocatellia bacterium]